MPGVSKCNVPRAALRWSIERAGVEFGIGSQTLRKSLAKNSTIADAGSCYTTKQIVAALFGALDQEKLATQKQLTKKYQIGNAVAEAGLLDRAALSAAFATLADGIVARIMSATELPREVREDVLRDIASWPLALDEVAHRQTRLPRRRNGARSDDDDD